MFDCSIMVSKFVQSFGCFSFNYCYTLTTSKTIL